MNIDEIFKNFADRLTEINLYQRSACDIAKKELEQLSLYAEKVGNNSQPVSTDVMYFYDARTGESTPYGFRQSSIEDKIKHTILRKNKQYCWLLAEAYEEFEDFIEAVYAYIGYKNNNNWLLSDFGNITFTELSKKDYDWYLENVKKKNKISDFILIIKKLYPELIEIETNNKLNVNLKVAVELIAHLRHIIVHKSGIVSDRDAFLKTVLEKSGLYNSGKYNQGYKTFIEKFFGDEEYRNTISLLEIRHSENSLSYFNPYNQLVGYLMAYSRLIFDNIKNSENIS